jgi:hypothetical protein
MADGGGLFSSITSSLSAITAAATPPAKPIELPTTPDGVTTLLADSSTAIAAFLENNDYNSLSVPASVLSKMFDKDIGAFMLGTALQMAQDPAKHTELKKLLFPEGTTPSIPVDKQDEFISALGDKTTYTDTPEGKAKFDALIEMADPGKAKLKANLSRPEDVQRLREEADKPLNGLDGMMVKFEGMKGKFADGFMAALENPTGPGAQALYSMPFIGPLLQSLMPMLSGLMKQLEGGLDSVNNPPPAADANAPAQTQGNTDPALAPYGQKVTNPAVETADPNANGERMAAVSKDLNRQFDDARLGNTGPRDPAPAFVPDGPQVV